MIIDHDNSHKREVIKEIDRSAKEVKETIAAAKMLICRQQESGECCVQKKDLPEIAKSAEVIDSELKKLIKNLWGPLHGYLFCNQSIARGVIYQSYCEWLTKYNISNTVLSEMFEEDDSERAGLSLANTKEMIRQVEMIVDRLINLNDKFAKIKTPIVAKNDTTETDCAPCQHHNIIGGVRAFRESVRAFLQTMDKSSINCNTKERQLRFFKVLENTYSTLGALLAADFRASSGGELLNQIKKTEFNNVTLAYYEYILDCSSELSSYIEDRNHMPSDRRAELDDKIVKQLKEMEESLGLLEVALSMTL